MARVFAICSALALAFVATGAADAQPLNVKATQTRTNETGDVTFTVTLGAAGQTYLTAEAPSVKFEKMSTATGIVVRVSVQGDAFELKADAYGQVDINRKGKAKRFRTRDLKRDDADEIQALLLGSTALRAFDALAAVLADSDRLESISVLATHAFVKALGGDPSAARVFARRLTARATGAVRLAAQRQRGDFQGPESCWQEYQQTVSRYASDFEKCYWDHSWNPIGQAVCSTEWLIKVELAWAWVIACHGGMPV